MRYLLGDSMSKSFQFSMFRERRAFKVERCLTFGSGHIYSDTG